jgi:acyl carrier protein
MSTVQPALENRIKAVFVQALNVEPPDDRTDLIESGVIDSLALVELLFALEQEFAVSLPLDTLDVESFRSIKTIGEFIAGLDGRAAE